MRGSLDGIRRRVEHVAADLQFGACDQTHVVHHVHNVWVGDPDPAREPAGNETCACGRRLEHLHIINRYSWENESAEPDVPRN